jgi:hypothetical protein
MKFKQSPPPRFNIQPTCYAKVVYALKLETTPRTHTLEWGYSSTHSLTLALAGVIKALARRKTSCRWRESNHSLFTIKAQWNKRILLPKHCSVNTSSVLYRMWRLVNKHARLTTLRQPHLRSQCSSPPADPSYPFLLVGVILTPSTSFLLWIALRGRQWTSHLLHGAVLLEKLTSELCS